jgi:hypothetical protein
MHLYSAGKLIDGYAYKDMTKKLKLKGRFVMILIDQGLNSYVYELNLKMRGWCLVLICFPVTEPIDFVLNLTFRRIPDHK